MQIRQDSYQIIYNQVLSRTDPRDYATPTEYFRSVDEQVYTWLVEQWNGQDMRYQAIADSIIHVLIAPPISTDPKQIVYGAETTIKDTDFPAFCRAYNVDESRVRAVSAGTLREWKGWMRSSRLSPVIFGSPYNPPKAPMSPGEKRKREQEIAREKERMAKLNYKTPTQAPPIVFNPNEPATVPSTERSFNPLDLLKKG